MFTSTQKDGCDNGVINGTLELREMFQSFQTGYKLANAAVVLAILESVSGLEPSSVISEPRSDQES